jgi:hypothetical protein
MQYVGSSMFFRQVQLFGCVDLTSMLALQLSYVIASTPSKTVRPECNGHVQLLLTFV